jgi:TusA-related sulfurtransferase
MDMITRTPDHFLDITKDVCPITFVKTKLLIEKAKSGDFIEVLLTGGEPIENVPRSVKEEGHTVICQEFEGLADDGRELYRLQIQKG